jgi:hypothetical protein
LVNFGRTGRMDEDQLSLRQAEQIRGDLYGLQDDLDFIKMPARTPEAERGLARGGAGDTRRCGRSGYSD